MPVIAVVSHDYPWSATVTACNRKTGVCRKVDPILVDAAGARERDVRWVRLPPEVELQTVVQMILDAKRPAEKITRLALYAHGNFGMVLLPGRNANPLKFLMRATASIFAPLRPHFHPFQRMIQIYACGVASDTSIEDWKGNEVPGSFKGDGKGVGYLMMKELATLTGCTVQAYVSAAIGNDSYRGQGTTVLVYPGGGYVTL
jgi:hypothetical protein